MLLSSLGRKMNNPIKVQQIENKERIYFPELDGLRFFAFMLVFIHHTSLFSNIPYLSILHSKGWIGVDLFFVLSAYLFTILLKTEYYKTQSINFKKFYIRRIFRIWPIYFLFIGLIMIAYFHMSEGIIIKDIWIRLIGLLTFSDNILAITKGLNPIPGTLHLWTVSYEEQFYIFIPIIIFLLVRASVKTRLILLCLVFLLFNGIRLLFIAKQVPHPAIWVFQITHFESFCLGIVIGFGGLNFLLERIRPEIIGFIGIGSFFLLLLLPALTTISYWLIVTYSLIGISTALVVLSVLNSIYLKELFSIRIFVFLGKRSYGLYVYHMAAIFLVNNYLAKKIPEFPSGDLALFLFSLSFTIIGSIVSYRIIEKPFLKLKGKFEVIVSRPV